MKKQFFRVKQLADQTFSRAGKTEALSDDLVAAEKRIEFLSKVCQNINKKIVSASLGQGQDTAAREKRLRKSTEYLLAVQLFESGTGEIDDILRSILVESSKIQLGLAEASVESDARIETSVVAPLQQIIDTDIPNVMKQKRNLTKLILDMDSARNRYQTALKHISSSNSTGSVTKVDSIKDELEDLEMKVEQCRDSLACEMFQLISKEAVLANVLLDYIKIQQAAHRSALTILDEMVPDLQSTIENSNIKPVFGHPLEDHLRITNRKIAYPLELCVCVLLELGMEEEGLFRVAGGTSKIRRLKYGLDANFVTMETAIEYRDVHVISSVLKSYFRELPEPLLTYKLYDEWLAAIRYPGDENAKLSALWTVLNKLPQANYDNLRYLIKFLSLLSKNQEINKMTSQNVAIVIAPNLIWSNNSNPNIGENMNLANQYSAIVEYLVKYADWFFNSDETFYLTIEDPNSRKKTHTRSNSADLKLMNVELTTSSESTIRRSQSTTSLEEEIRNCPLQESPKPVIRTRKNKPAPIPPISSPNSCPSSTNSASSKEKLNPNETKSSNLSVQYSRNHPSTESSPTNVTVCISHRESFDFKDVADKLDKLDDNHEDDIEEKSAPKSPKFKPPIDDSTSTVSPEVSKLLSVESLNKILESKKLAKPVPAPRISLESSSKPCSSDELTPRKPVIPEKPAVLPRPMSCTFKSFKPSEIPDGIKIEVEKYKGPSLEKAHLYSVDKQQVSFIEIASTNDEGSVNDSLVNHDHSTLRSRPSFSTSDKTFAEKHEIPCKSEISSNSGQNSSHVRALSDGHNVEITNTVNLPSHRSFHRVQRPIPPPPPPPVVAKTQARSGSISDSTNL